MSLSPWQTYEKLVGVHSREKLVRVSYRLAARYFSHEFLASNRACFISCKFLMRVFGASFSYEFLVRLSWALGRHTAEMVAVLQTSLTTHAPAVLVDFFYKSDSRRNVRGSVNSSQWGFDSVLFTWQVRSVLFDWTEGITRWRKVIQSITIW